MTAGALCRALEAGDETGAAAAVVQLCSEAGRIGTAAILAQWVGAASGPWMPVTVALADALRAGVTVPSAHSALPLAQIAAIAAARLRSGSCAPGGAAADVAALVGELYAAAERTGEHAAVVAAVVELSDAIGSSADALVLRCRAALGAARGRAGTAEQAARTALIDDRFEEFFGAASPDKGASFREPKFRRHLLQGDADKAFRAMARALAFGVPRPALASSVGLAAAGRLLRFDPAIDAAEGRPEGWSDLIEAQQLAAATARLGLRYPHPHWARLLLYAAFVVNDLRRLDAPPARRFALPDPEPLVHTRDHGPELAKIRARLLRGDASEAIAGLRGYLMLALPEQPLAAQLLDAAFEDFPTTAAGQGLVIATVSACVELFTALGDHPHRELALCAALRTCCAPLGRRGAHRAARRALEKHR